LQAAKGNPGKRLTKAEKAQAEADRLAQALASAPAESGDVLAPPTMMLDERLKPAITVWRSLASDLAKMNVLTVLDRHAFAVYCIAVADYYAAVNDVLANGQTYLATTDKGNKMRRTNPAVAIKERLAKFVFDAGAEFGLTPLTRYSLLREQAAHGGGQLPQNVSNEDPQSAPQSSADDLIGFAQRIDSPPLLQ
jgi:P27 family predicted phage terminase small subunit